MKQGKEYELFIEKLYRELEPNAEIKQDDYIIGHQSGVKRQIDVSIRYSFIGIDQLIIVQAKDYKRKADLNDVGEFLTVIKDVNANQGILICNKGFTKPAINLASKHNLELLSVHSAQNKRWETLVEIRVEKTVYTFDSDCSFLVDIHELAGQEVKLYTDFYSFDQKKLVGLSDIIIGQVVNKTDEKRLFSGKEIAVKADKMRLFMYYEDKFREILSGHLIIKFLRKKSIDYYVSPSDYTIENNHSKSQEKTHKIILDGELFDSIMSHEIDEEPSAESTLNTFKSNERSISVKVFDFSHGLLHGTFKFNFPAILTGGYFFNDKERSLMPVNPLTETLIKIERRLKTE